MRDRKRFSVNRPVSTDQSTDDSPLRKAFCIQAQSEELIANVDIPTTAEFERKNGLIVLRAPDQNQPGREIDQDNIRAMIGARFRSKNDVFVELGLASDAQKHSFSHTETGGVNRAFVLFPENPDDRVLHTFQHSKSDDCRIFDLGNRPLLDQTRSARINRPQLIVVLRTNAPDSGKEEDQKPSGLEIPALGDGREFAQNKDSRTRATKNLARLVRPRQSELRQGWIHLDSLLEKSRSQ